MPAVFLGHGSPMNAVARNRYTDAWSALGQHLGRPKAVLAVSAHWYVPGTGVTISTAPRTLHDFGGFPPELYQVSYPAPGDPALARRVQELLAPLPVAFDERWGLDHGTWAVLRHVYPYADVPIVQLSLQEGLDPATHLAMGRALAPLRDEGVLIIGSGMSYHNLRELLGNGSRGNDASERFDSWLTQAVEDPDPGARDNHLAHWSEAPGALNAHPRSEHLLPLMVAAGAAGDDRGRRVFNDRIWGKAISGYQFG